MTVTDGGKFSGGDTLSIESESLYVTAISTNDLTVTRGVNGTTAAAHDDSTDVYLFRFPGSVAEACLLQTARLWKRKDLASAPADQGQAGPMAGLDAEAQRLLAPYRRLPLGTGV